MSAIMAIATHTERVSARASLGTKLLVLTILFVMVSEVAIFVPSIANYRLNWLNDAHRNASVAAAIIAETPNVPEGLKLRLLTATNTISLSSLNSSAAH